MKLFNIKDIQFNQILGNIKDYLSSTLGTTVNLGRSSVFGQLITAISAVAHNIMLYIEDSLVEQNKYTAQRKKSIYALAAQSGYQPSLGRAAGVWVKITHKPINKQIDPNRSDVIIQNKTKIMCTQNSTYYCLDLHSPSVVISKNTDSVTTYFYAVQGKFETQRFVATGGKLYNQHINYIGLVDLSYMNVTVNGEEWRRADSLYDMSAEEHAYFVTSGLAGGIDVTFGNGMYGKALKQGDVVVVSFLLHDGEGGNLTPKPDNYFVFTTKLRDVNGNEVDGNSVFDITFASKDAVSSGENAESIDNVRQMIGYNSRSMILSDSNAYKAFLNRFSFVGYNRTWSEPGSLIIKSLVMKNYQMMIEKGMSYFDLTESDFVLSEAQKSSIKNAISNSGMQLAGTTYDIIDTEICKYAVTIYIKLKNTDADKPTITTKVKNIIAAFFSDIKSDTYIPKSDLITAIKNGVEDIDGINLYFLSEKNERARKDGQYEETEYLWDPSRNAYKKRTNTIKVLPGVEPMLGLDNHGNILLKSDEQYPVIMGGWSWASDLDQNTRYDVIDPVTIIYE